MSGVDSRIVTMKFDNKQFQQGAAETMSTLDKLRTSLNLPGASKGLENLTASTSSLEGGITKINGAFVALGAVAVTAISNITTKIMGMGSALASELSMVNAMKDGFADYELKVGATQTIMAGTGENIGEVTKYLKELDIYADKTIYSLSDMVGNIGKFTNAGVKLPVAVDAMKGISNVAALSGASAEEAARSMYNLGQAIGNGTVKLMDWRSVELANMGTKEFKEQLIQSALAAGTLKKGLDGTIKSTKGSVVNYKTFSGTLKDGWLTAEALTTTLSRYADETTKIGKKAYAAATEVKTFSMMMETLKAAAGTGWTDTFEIIIGTLPEATELFTGMTNAIGGVIGASADARNKLLGDWKALGGRTKLIEGIKNIFDAIGAVIRPIKEAFRDIFPAATGKQLFALTEGFLKFTEKLKIGASTALNLKDTFKGVFAVFSIIKQVIGGVTGFIFDLVGALGTGTGGFSVLTGKIGSFLSSLDETLKKGELVKNFFEKLSNVLTPIVATISGLAGALIALLVDRDAPFLDELSAKFESLAPIIETIRSSIDQFVTFVKTKLSGLGGIFNFGGDASDPTAGMQASLSGLPSIMDRIRESWAKVVEVFQAGKSQIQPVIDNLKNTFATIKDKIAEFVDGIGIEEALSLINTGFFIALYMALRSFINKIGGLFDEMGGMFKSAGGVLDQLTSNLKTMQAEVKADIILKIAASLALLAAAVYVLAQVDAKKLAIALGAISAMLLELVAAIKMLEKGSSLGGSMQLTLLSVGLLGLSVALVAMSAAIALLGNMETSTLIKGITAVSAVLAVVITAAGMLSKSGGSGAILVASAAILVLSVSLTAFAGALKLYSMIDTSTMLEGGLKIAAALWAIAVVMGKMPPNMIASSFALIIVAQALVILSGALKMMGSLSVEEMAKSLTTLGLSLLIIAVGLNAMTGAIGGAAAMALFAVALGLLIPPLMALGEIDFKTLAVALLSLAAIFAVLGLSALVMAPIVPVLTALAGAIALLGLAAMAVGGGLLLFATGLGVLAASGAAGAAVLIGVITSIAQLFPLIMHQIGLGMVAFAVVIGQKAPIVVEAIGKLLVAMLKKTGQLIPLLPPVINKAITAFLKVLTDSAPKFARAGWDIIIGIVEGATDKVPKLVRKAGDFVTAFMNAWSEEIPRLADSGAKAVIKLINGIADAIRNNTSDLKDAGRNLASAILSGMTGGLTGGIGAVKDAARSVAKSALNSAMSFLGIKSPSKEFYKIGRFLDEGLAEGMLAYTKTVTKASQNVGSTALETMQETLNKLSDSALSDVNLSPVITPVLDLTNIQTEASKINSMFGVKKVSPQTSYNEASGISLTDQNESTFGTTKLNSEPSIVFEQNNYSPKALSAVELYRQTRNQLSLAKGVLV